MLTFDQLEKQFQEGKITMAEYLSTPTEPGSFKISDSKKHGRKAAKRQAQLVKNHMIAKNIENKPEPTVIESNSVCEMCGNEAVAPKSLCCDAKVITPSAYAKPHEIRLTSTPGTAEFSVFFTGEKAILRSTSFVAAGANPTTAENVWPNVADAEKFVRDMYRINWKLERREATVTLSPAIDVTPEQTPIQTDGENWVAAPAHLKTVEHAKDFVLAGNAYFTVRSLSTGTRYTFRVSSPHKNPEETCKYCHNLNSACTCSPVWFVNYLAGPDNGNDYVYLGWIRSNKFDVTRASKRLENSQVFKAFRWVWEHLVNNQLPPKTEIWHEGRCGRCGHRLTVPESIESGIGPVCEGKE